MAKYKVSYEEGHWFIRKCYLGLFWLLYRENWGCLGSVAVKYDTKQSALEAVETLIQ